MNAEFARAVEKMYSDHLSASSLYHASQFWEKLNRLNLQWIETDGIENFKRTINTNYFSWTVGPRSVHFRNMLGAYLRFNASRPAKWLRPIFVRPQQMTLRTFMKADLMRPGYPARKLYGAYLYMLSAYVEHADPFGSFSSLSEPACGNPLWIDVSGRKVSQDLCNSYLEYSFIRQSLGGRYDAAVNLLEIGSGYGRLAFVVGALARAAGQRKRYIFVDLPVALSLAQWYLRKVVPEASVFCYRDFSKFEQVRQEFEASDFCFLLPHQLELLPAKYVDVLINISSLQEMTRAQINAYYRLIDEKARLFYTKQWVLWRNPDDQLVVPAVIYPTRPHWQILSGRLNPVHSDFFEAIFDLGG